METPGMMLKCEREARGLTLLELSKVTRIPASSLEAIEKNAFDTFAAEVFVKGFLRNYARQLSIPVDEIMQSYTAWQQQNKIEPQPVEAASLAAANTDTPAASNTDNVPHLPTFRFAYIAIILIAAASLGLSVLFMGTGEAEESDADFNVQTGSDAESPFIISNTSEGWLAE